MQPVGEIGTQVNFTQSNRERSCINTHCLIWTGVVVETLAFFSCIGTLIVYNQTCSKDLRKATIALAWVSIPGALIICAIGIYLLLKPKTKQGDCGAFGAGALTTVAIISLGVILWRSFGSHCNDQN